MLRLASIVIGVLLASVATPSLFAAHDSHVAMCMLGAATLAIGFLWNAFRPSATIQAVACFAAGWTFLYSVLTMTTALACWWYVGDAIRNPPGSIDPIYVYHVSINLPLLLVFWMGFDAARPFFLGTASALVLSPVMLLVEATVGWASSVESAGMIVAYVGIGLILMGAYRLRLAVVLGRARGKRRFARAVKSVLWLYLLIAAALLVLTKVLPDGPG